MARKDHVRHLSEIELFKNSTKKELNRIARAGTEVNFAPGAEIVGQGDVGTEAYVILEGTATVRRGTRKIATLGPGDPVGELALLDKGTRTAYVIADGEVETLRLSAKEFGKLLDEMPSLSRKLLSTLAARVRELDRRV